MCMVFAGKMSMQEMTGKQTKRNRRALRRPHVMPKERQTEPAREPEREPAREPEREPARAAWPRAGATGSAARDVREPPECRKR